VKKPKSVKPFKAWIGFSDGKPHLYSSEYYCYTKHGDFFVSKKAAKVCYEDARQFLITPISKKERKP
jgi:hypothetical protein